jgi:hypothetical protein
MLHALNCFSKIIDGRHMNKSYLSNIFMSRVLIRTRNLHLQLFLNKVL